MIAELKESILVSARQIREARQRARGTQPDPAEPRVALIEDGTELFGGTGGLLDQLGNLPG